MKMLVKGVLAVFSCLLLGAGGCGTTRIVVQPDVVLSDVSHHPIGINIDYFMDDDAYLQPKARSTTDALRDMGMKYLRYPGGTNRIFTFSQLSLMRSLSLRWRGRARRRLGAAG